MDSPSMFLSRVVALRRARDAAKNPQFKLLWSTKLKELIAKNSENDYDTVH
jgi:hypothetical protein